MIGLAKRKARAALERPRAMDDTFVGGVDVRMVRESMNGPSAGPFLAPGLASSPARCPTRREPAMANDQTQPTIQERRQLISLLAQDQDLSWLDGVASDPVALVLGCLCAEVQWLGCTVMELGEKVGGLEALGDAVGGFLNGIIGLSAKTLLDADDGDEIDAVRQAFRAQGAQIRAAAGLSPQPPRLASVQAGGGSAQ